MRPRSPTHFAPQQTSSRPFTTTRSSARQQKLTSPAFSLVAEKKIVNGCSGFRGARNFTVRIPVGYDSSRPSTNAASTSSRITTPGTRGAPGKCPGKLGWSARITRRTSKVIRQMLLLDRIKQSIEWFAPAGQELTWQNQIVGNTARRHGVLPRRTNQTAIGRIGGSQIAFLSAWQPERACAALLPMTLTSRNDRRFVGLRPLDRDKSPHILCRKCGCRPIDLVRAKICPWFQPSNRLPRGIRRTDQRHR